MDEHLPISLGQRVTRRLRYEYLRRFENPAVLRTRQGVFRVPLGVSDPISRNLFLDGAFELDLIVEAMTLLRGLTGRQRGTGTVLDIGANNGVISIGMLVTGEVATAIAVEPEPRNFARLEDNVALNALQPRVRTLNRAVSDRAGSLEFELSESNYGDHRVRTTAAAAGPDVFGESARQVISVSAQTTDDLLAGIEPELTQDIAVMWIDVQGYEGFVFRGARQLLATGVPVVSEIWPYGIVRAGMTLEDFGALVAGMWPYYWVKRRGRFVRYPTVAFASLLDEIGAEGSYENVIFTHHAQPAGSAEPAR